MFSVVTVAGSTSFASAGRNILGLKGAFDLSEYSECCNVGTTMQYF